MKATNQIENTPVFKSVTVEFTPREAYLLCLLVGGHCSKVELQRATDGLLEKTPWGKGDGFPSCVFGPLTKQDENIAEDFYEKIRVVLWEAYNLTTN